MKYVVLGWNETESLGTRVVNGPLYQPQIVDERNEHLVVWQLGGEIEVLGENVPQCYFNHDEFHINWSRDEPGPQRREASV
jgi:hypothetical protein